MVRHPAARLGFAALFSSYAVMAAPAAEMTPAGIDAAQALQSTCGNMRGANNRISEDALLGCLSEIKKQTIALSDIHKEFFSITGDAIRQDPSVAGAAGTKLNFGCTAINQTYSPATPEEAIMTITGAAIECLNVVYDTGNLSTVRMDFDLGRHAVVLINGVCVRGLVDAEAKATCTEWRNLAGVPSTYTNI